MSLPPISPARWRALEPLLDRALAMPPEERRRFVADPTTGDAATRAELARMLSECAEDDALLERPAVERFAELWDERPDEDALRAGLASRYAVEHEIGRGGMGVVYRARDVRHDRVVALKVLPRELGAGRAAERFLAEIRVTARLRHPHVLPLFDSGETAGRLWYATPFVAGGTLRDRLRREAPLPLAEARRLLAEIADALACAHGQGVLHRDVKPENVLLDGGHAVLADFGIATALARAAGTDGAQSLHTGTVRGTPAYMAPEQLCGDPTADERADLYAWGCVAYELLAGAPPFAGLPRHQLAAAHIVTPTVPLRERAPEVPPWLAALVMRCLEKSASARPASAAALVAALAVGEHADDAAHADDASRHRPRPRRGARRARAAGLAGVAVMALAVGGWSLVPAEARVTLRTLVSRSPARLRVNRVVVAPFRDETGDARFAALGPLVADYLTEGLSRLGSLQVVDARTAAATGDVVQAIPRLLRAADDVALGEETGAQVVVAGSYYLDGDTLRIRARVLDAATREVRQAFPPVAALASAPAPALAALGDRVVATLRAASDSDGVALGERSPPPSLAAFAALQEGWQAYVHRRPDSVVVASLLRAAAIDSTYGTPLAGLSYLAAALGLHATSDAAQQRAAPMRETLTVFEQSLLDVAAATARGDMPGALAAALRGPPNEHLIAYQALLARRPAVVLRVLAPMDPDRGINIPWAHYYWGRVAIAHAQLGRHAEALAAVRAGERRSTLLRAQGLEAAIAAARGDTAGVHAALEARWRAGERPASIAARATTLLRTRGGHDEAGRRMARQWADRLYPRGAPLDTAGLGQFIPPAVELLVAAERWDDLLPVLDAAHARFAADSAAGRGTPRRLAELSQRLRTQRAVALVHLDRRAEALAIDAALARTVGARWDRGVSAVGRATIAAHLGERQRALVLLEQAVEQGALDAFLRHGAAGLATVDGDPLLLPLRGEPAFRALARPDPADR